MTDSDRAQGIQHIWPEGPVLVGMVHLLPLPGSPRWGGSMSEVLDRAVVDARSLEAVGFSGVLVENFLDAPFFADGVPAETIAAITAATSAIITEVSCPVGVNVLRNDAAGALGVAAVTGAAFIRVNVHTGAMWTDQGLVEGKAHETLRRRSGLGLGTAILADVHVKHAAPPPGYSLGQAAADAWGRGLADALVVSGSGTGTRTSIEDVQRVRDAVAGAHILVGSGLDAENAAGLLEVADGAIVGTSVMNEGRPGAGIDPGRAATLVEAVGR